ncbi:MAG: Multidrug transporter EmrE [Acidimicrobiales bacterium]|nr:MAG: QacE family quaternary ammonium compound efflux SMR transporter [Actinomycetota bacterium]MBV6508027.1 Multidrug transporter EmrE [Acidimicrobiales bacterium]RIK05344.1 MAG: QacE family quaternary ammonium compound efflux SMR transporter [Acidobacteriota bacterium]
MGSWLLLAGAIVAEVIGTSLLKESEGFTRALPTVVSLLAYGVAFFCLSLAIRHIDLGLAYAIWSGVGTALIVLIAWVVFDQSLDWAALGGVGLIVLGVVVINAFSDIGP